MVYVSPWTVCDSIDVLPMQVAGVGLCAPPCGITEFHLIFALVCRVASSRMLRLKTLKDTVILIYANKSDYEDAMTVNELIEGLDVHRVIGDRKWFIQRSCAISGQGLNEGIDWLCRAMQAKSSTPSSSSSSSGSSKGSIGFLPITPRLLGKGRLSDPLDESGSENDLQ